MTPHKSLRTGNGKCIRSVLGELAVDRTAGYLTVIYTTQTFHNLMSYGTTWGDFGVMLFVIYWAPGWNRRRLAEFLISDFHSIRGIFVFAMFDIYFLSISLCNSTAKLFSPCLSFLSHSTMQLIRSILLL